MFFFIILQTALAVDQVRFNLGQIEFNNILADEVAVQLVTGSGEAASVHISVSRLSLPTAGTFKQLEIDCGSGSLTATTLRCLDGSFHVHSINQGNISGRIDMLYHLDGSKGEVALSGITAGTGKISGSLAFDSGGWQARLQGTQLDLSWLHKTVVPYNVWPADYSDESGNLDVDIHINNSQASGYQAEGFLRAHDIGFYGKNAAENFSGEVSFKFAVHDGWQIKAKGNLDGGALYIEPGITLGNVRPGIALELDEQPLRFSLDSKLDEALQRIEVVQLAVEQAGVITANARAEFVRGEKIQVDNADVSLSASDTGQFYRIWLQPFLLETGFNMLETKGALTARALIKNNIPGYLELLFTDVDADDTAGRFHITGLDGSLRISESATPVASGLSWQDAGIYRLEAGAGKLALESSNQEVKIVSWEDVPILDGELRIDTLNMSGIGTDDMTLRLDGELTPIAMTELTRAMDWPVMSGELTGAIEGLIYEHGDLVVNGEINIGLFDGNIVIRNLSIEDLFGLVPALRADIDIQSLDLELVTNRFSFGYIQGRLSGKIHKLELQAWQPVYFEAELMTPEHTTTRHRISQQAVDNLGYLGGGAINALSGGLLSLFKDYSYGRLGISCRLLNNVCHLGGIRETEDGFIIVSRGGLLPPWIEVRGTGHSIAWPVLVEGLKTIAKSKPEIR